MIRDAILKDGEALSEIGCQLVASKLRLRPDKIKIKNMVDTAISSRAQKLILDTTALGAIDGAILVATAPFDFAEKLYAYIAAVHFKTKVIAERLVREAMDWIAPRKGVQLVTYSMPVASVVDTILRSHGFAREGTMLVWRRYGTVQ